MGEILQLDYYYGIEAEQFSFYRVPRLLIKDDYFCGEADTGIAVPSQGRQLQVFSGKNGDQ